MQPIQHTRHPCPLISQIRTLFSVSESGDVKQLVCKPVSVMIDKVQYFRLTLQNLHYYSSLHVTK